MFHAFLKILKRVVVIVDVVVVVEVVAAFFLVGVSFGGEGDACLT